MDSSDKDPSPPPKLSSLSPPGVSDVDDGMKSSESPTNLQGLADHAIENPPPWLQRLAEKHENDKRVQPWKSESFGGIIGDRNPRAYSKDGEQTPDLFMNGQVTVKDARPGSCIHSIDGGAGTFSG
jgi:hypothetical protein